MDEIGLKPGSKIASGKREWMIIKLHGKNEFGGVYYVHDEKDKKKKFRLKVEKIFGGPSPLKMELAILKDMNTKPEFNKHFTNIVDRGREAKFFYIVVDVVGKSLDDLKRERPHRVFSMGTAIGASQQCLESVAAMHKNGYIHRDLKPANYACGLGDQKRVIFLLDFGIVRKFKKRNEKSGAIEIKTPREYVAFKGTVRFASLACHRNKEMGPKDDCESWYYLLIDLCSPAGLPWRKLDDKVEVRKIKEEYRTEKGIKKFITDIELVKPQFIEIMQYIDKLQYFDEVDYSFIYGVLATAATNSNTNLDEAYDWEKPSSATPSTSSTPLLKHSNGKSPMIKTTGGDGKTNIGKKLTTPGQSTKADGGNSRKLTKATTLGGRGGELKCKKKASGEQPKEKKSKSVGGDPGEPTKATTLGGGGGEQKIDGKPGEKLPGSGGAKGGAVLSTAKDSEREKKASGEQPKEKKSKSVGGDPGEPTKATTLGGGGGEQKIDGKPGEKLPGSGGAKGGAVLSTAKDSERQKKASGEQPKEKKSKSDKIKNGVPLFAPEMDCGSDEDTMVGVKDMTTEGGLSPLPDDPKL